MVYLRPRHRRLLRRQKTLPIKKVKIIPKRRFTLPKIGQPFINRGKIWQFCARIADKNPIKVIYEEFGMNSAAETNNGIYLRCKSFRSQNTYNCPRKGIFHKANGCLYTIGKHEHQDDDHQPAAGNVPNKLNAGKNVIKGRKIATMKRMRRPCRKAMNRPAAMVQIPRQQQNNHHRRFFVDRLGRKWNFLAEIGQNIQQIRDQYGLSTRQYSKNAPIYLQCRKVGYGGDGRCAFAGIYTDGCLFTRRGHEHKYQFGQNVRKQRANNNGQRVGTKRRKLEGNVRKRPPANNNGRNVDAKRRKLDNNNLAKVVVNVQIYEPPKNNAIRIQQQQNNIVEEIVANNNLEQQNAGGGIQQQEQNGINLAALEPEVEIVADINLGKWLPHIKKEPQIQEFPILTIHDDNNLAANAKLARIKNEVADPEEEPPRRPIAPMPMPIVEVNRPPQIVAQNQMPAAPAPVHKMLLRERKIAINYGK